MSRRPRILLWIGLFLIMGGSLRDIHSQSNSNLSSLLAAMNSFDSFRANITLNGSLTGTLSYKRPGNLHIKFSDGRVISANGKTLWFYSPDRGIAAKQDLKGSSSGLSGLLSGYEDISAGRSVKLKSESKRYSEISIALSESNLPKSIRMKPSGSTESTEIIFSGIATNIGLTSSLFNFQPPSSSLIVENPLNQKE
ncbi:MAG: outer membrane lipoprotein carrier protein LolA [Leptospiraceae bacterium]|jgi:outer membrane lipoprotein carrier protein|nr:outer membrane lipoprotein carrier protein LolA [Leptospiraceae bacterium]MCZ8240061.1 outer membrane lipoprotein carrier protein LolA [Leptospiraceae bacterium]MCZ8347930.1 outer membrane lipoprotein carrier protein LolA [Leptospiraceae bacterium]